MAIEAPLFITAKEVSREQVNRLLVYLRDWEYGSGDRFSIIATRDRTTIINATVTQPPINRFENDENAWSGATLDDIEEFVKEIFPDKRPFVVLDEDGLRTQQCVIFASDINPETGESSNDFVKIRVPWRDTYIVWANLDLANMEMEEFSDGERQPDRWYQYDSRTVRGDAETLAWEAERDAFLDELERAGRL